MSLRIEESFLEALSSFSLPSYKEIPDVGLYLNQAVSWINRILEPVLPQPITESMISNYVKRRLLPAPVKKQYTRETISSLIFIAVAKSVVSLDDIALLLRITLKSFRYDEAYEYFSKEFESVYRNVFGLGGSLSDIEGAGEMEKEMLRKILVTAANSRYIGLSFSILSKDGL